MIRQQQPALLALAVGLIGLALLTLIYGDFALVWQPVPPAFPGRLVLAYASGMVMLLAGMGLLVKSSAAWSARILFPYFLLWLLLKVPALVVAPAMEAVWLGFGEIAVLFAAGWILFALLGEVRSNAIFAFLTSAKGVRVAAMLFGAALLPIGLSHIIYTKQTIDLIPSWLPMKAGLAYLTGAGQICCGLAVLLSITPHIAAMIEAAMVGVFAILVWVPAIFASPTGRLPWTAFFITWLFAASAWVVASNMPSRKAS